MKRKQSGGKKPIEQYEHKDKKRANIPPVGLVTPETLKAFRDTWELGIHSYLTYLRDRLLLAKDLLHESGSCFVANRC